VRPWQAYQAHRQKEDDGKIESTIYTVVTVENLNPNDQDALPYGLEEYR
jgi:hypothetical protein